MPDRILVGRFGAPHGVRGEIRVQSFTAEPRSIADYGPLLTSDGRRFTFSSVRAVKDNMIVARVVEVADRDSAAALTNIELFADRASLPPPGDDEFYVADLVGMTAVDEAGNVLGTVLDVPNYGGGDLLEIAPRDGGDSHLYPFTRAVVPTIDFAGRTLTVLPPEEVEATDEIEATEPEAE